jgi:hypothetical protein
LVESVKRCTGNSTFLDRFYEQLLTRAPQLNDWVADTDTFRHRFLLGRLVQVMVRHAAGIPGAEKSMGELAREFGPAGLNLPEVYYRGWVAAVMATVREVDPLLTPQLEVEWQQVMTAECGHFLAAVGDIPKGW